MIQKSTVIKRFTKAFGEPKLSKSGLYIMGGDLDIYGLTTRLNECNLNFVKYYYKENQKIPTAEIVSGSKFCTDYSFIVGEDESSKTEVAFTEDRLIAGYHVLDSKPFERIQVQYFPNCSLPIVASREIEGEILSVLIAPFEMPYYSGNAWLTDKVVPRWIRAMPNSSTFWLVEFDRYNRRGVKIGVEEMIKCYNCRVELLVTDYVKQIIDRQHPECMCVCNTYDDFCGCIRKRLYNQMMSQARSLSQTKMRMRKELS